MTKVVLTWTAADTVGWSCPDFVDTYPVGEQEEEESTMPKSRPPYPAAFRQQMVELVRSGRTPGELAREFEPSAEAIRKWVAQADRDAGKRADGLSTEEREEVRRLRRGEPASARRTGHLGESNRLVRAGDRIREDYRFMSANQGRFCVATMARVLGVSPSGYYAWRRRPPSARAQADAELTARVQEIYAGSRGTYGVPRIHAELAEAGVAVSRKRVARVMRTAGIAGVSRRRGPRTTRRALRARPAPDRVERRFEADEPNRLWVADITYVPTLVGFVYLAIVTRRVQPAGCRLGDGGAPAHRAGHRSVGDGHRAAPTRSGRASLRPGLPVHVAGLRRSLPRRGRGAVDGLGGRLLR